MSERDRLTADRTANMLARRALLDTESFASEVWRPETYLRSSALGVNGDSEEAVHAAVRVLSATADFSLCEVRKAICRHHHDFFLIADLLKENLDGSVDEMLAKINTIKASSKTLILETLNHTNDLYTSNINHLNLNLKSKQKDLLDQKKKAAAKMLELYETIAGFEWSLLSPKRYVVFEGTGITEIVENHQPKYVTLFLFNDALATASKITGITFSSSLASKRLALDRFWSLEDIQIVDLPDTKSVQNSFKIIKTDEIVLFVAENDTAKRLWMQQIIKTIANLKIKPNSETSIYPSSKVESAQADRNEFAGMFHKSRGPTLSEEVYQMLTSDLSLISERTCLCDFEGAVQLVDKVRFELSSVKNEDHKFDSIGHNYEESVEISNYELCKDKLEHEIDILASFLNHELMHPMLSKDECSTYVRLLFVLGRGEEASERFLASRSELIKDRVK